MSKNSAVEDPSFCEEIYESGDEKKRLSEIFNECAAWYSRYSIDALGLSERAYNCLNRYMDPPQAAPTGCHWTIDELLEKITLEELKSIRNLGRAGCMEILRKLAQFLNKNGI